MNRRYNLNNMEEWLTVTEIDTLINALKTKSTSDEKRIGIPKYKSVTEISQQVHEVSLQFEDIFEEIRENGKIPIKEIEADIIPTIVQAAEIPHIYHLFKEMQKKNEYTFRHNICVGVIATNIGKWLGLSKKELSKLTLAATLHDIGKTMIPESILNKPGKLTEVEYEEMKRHTIYGYKLIKNIHVLPQSISLVALQHHEREDGRGYPMRLKGENIHYFSKIVAIADIFHAMSSKRVYHEAIPFFEVISQMKDSVFGKLNPTILLLFLNKLMDTLVGKEIELSNLQRGKIIMIHPYDPLHALVKTDEGIIDLSKKKDLKIVQVIN